MKRHDRVRHLRYDTRGEVIDVHTDTVHVSVLPDGGRTLVRWRIPEIELLQ